MTGASPEGTIVLFARDMMTRSVVTIGPDTPRNDIQRLMHEHAIRHLPVLEAGRLVGIVSDRDVRSAASAPTASARQLMTAKPVTVTPDIRVEHAARLMLEHRFGALPVVEDGVVVGIVTYTDLLRAFVHTLETATAERIAVDWRTA
jgi:acetoin utilization protein AcuB